MDWLAAASVPIRLKTLLLLVWLLWPALYLLRAVVGVVRRARLRSRPVTVTGAVIEVRPAGDAGTLGEAQVVDMRVQYDIGGNSYSHTVTRADHQHVGYHIGSAIDLVCEDGNPGNVVDAAKRPWDDVIGPLVLAVLLAFFMVWAWRVLFGF